MDCEAAAPAVVTRPAGITLSVPPPGMPGARAARVGRKGRPGLMREYGFGQLGREDTPVTMPAVATGSATGAAVASRETFTPVMVGRSAEPARVRMTSSPARRFGTLVRAAPSMRATRDRPLRSRNRACPRTDSGPRSWPARRRPTRGRLGLGLERNRSEPVRLPQERPEFGALESSTGRCVQVRCQESGLVAFP